MREILFRGKRTDNNKWIEGNLVKFNGKTYIVSLEEKLICRAGKMSYMFYDVVLETVGQFAGLTDKNGRKIFEGDIIRAIHNKEELNTSYINFEDGIYWCELITGSFIECCETLFEQHCECGLEVIGNVHDNPELLGGDKNETD